MDQLIREIFEIIRDYRSDEGLPQVQMSTSRIKNWVNQFDESDRIFILTELKGILLKRYCSKPLVLEFLKEELIEITQHFKYSNVPEFLLETVFLDLQRPKKSQPTLLKLLKGVLSKEFHFDINLCGSKKVKNYIYLDDVLCTGNTLFHDIKQWVNTTDSDGQKYLVRLQSKEIRLIFIYLCVHSTNYFKKISQFRRQVAQDFENCFIFFGKFVIPNGVNTNLEIIMPTIDDQPDIVILYQKKVETVVNEYCSRNNINQPNAEFYRSSNQPPTEHFFSSTPNRKRFEDIILKKGVEILNAANTNIPNLRSLGYSLPSQLNFGFGTLFITWRNVPNNCPIVFWYSGGGFTPLFVKHQT